MQFLVFGFFLVRNVIVSCIYKMWKSFYLCGFLVDYKVVVFIHLVKCSQNVISKMWFFTNFRSIQESEQTNMVNFWVMLLNVMERHLIRPVSAISSATPATASLKLVYKLLRRCLFMGMNCVGFFKFSLHRSLITLYLQFKSELLFNRLEFHI